MRIQQFTEESTMSAPVDSSGSTHQSGLNVPTDPLRASARSGSKSLQFRHLLDAALKSDEYDPKAKEIVNKIIQKKNEFRSLSSSEYSEAMAESGLSEKLFKEIADLADKAGIKQPYPNDQQLYHFLNNHKV